jgi:IrrE N-terminal-like domain
LNSDQDVSLLGMVAESLATIWNPSVEALKVHLAMNVKSVGDLIACAEQAGFEVNEVDLPDSVGGFAQMIDGTPHIVVNRRKSARHREFTLAHEWGHHRLHVNPTSDASRFIPQTPEMMEFEANLFASSFIVWRTPASERDDLFKRNPEFGHSMMMPVLMSAAAVFAGLMVHICSVISESRNPTKNTLP